MNKMFARLGLGLATLTASAGAFALGTVPAAVQSAVDSASADGVAILTAVVVGMAAIGLLSRAFSKSGIK